MLVLLICEAALDREKRVTEETTKPEWRTLGLKLQEHLGFKTSALASLRIVMLLLLLGKAAFGRKKRADQQPTLSD